MTEFSSGMWSSIGKKCISGFTGLSLVLFVMVHLAGNMLLLVGSDAFNAYAHFLMHLGHGAFIYVAEAGLILFFLMHMITGVQVALDKRRARPTAYAVNASKGGPSRQTYSSKSMIFTGVVLFAFVIYHLIHFKFGAGEAAGYVTAVHGQEMRDLYRLVLEEFNKPVPVVLYTAVMVLLGFHLRHGFWSAFQSLGLHHPKYSRALYVAGLVVAVLLAVGFLFIPLYMFFFVDPVTAVQAGGVS